MQDNLLILNSTIDINLPDYITRAIDQGFAVPLMFEVEALADKKYWIDKKILSLKQQYQLHFLPMLGSYAIYDLNANHRDYFNSRQAAVRHLEVVNDYPMFDINNINQFDSVYMRIRAGIDIEALPLPLQSSSFWDNDWALQSDWFEWNLEPLQ